MTLREPSRIRAVVSEIMASPLVTGTKMDRFSALCEHKEWGHLDQIPVVEDGRIIGVCENPAEDSTLLGSCIGLPPSGKTALAHSSDNCA